MFLTDDPYGHPCDPVDPPPGILDRMIGRTIASALFVLLAGSLVAAMIGSGASVLMARWNRRGDCGDAWIAP